MQISCNFDATNGQTLSSTVSGFEKEGYTAIAEVLLCLICRAHRPILFSTGCDR